MAARFDPYRPILGWVLAAPRSRTPEAIQPGQRLQPQQMVQNRVGQRRATRIVAVRQHHYAAAVVWQQMRIAIVAEPGAAVMMDRAGAAMVPDKEAEAIVHPADFGKIRVANIDLRRRELGRRGL